MGGQLDNHPPDIVIPVRPGDNNEELRYTLRGISAHVPHRYVWLVGHRPPWVSDDVRHIHTIQLADKWTNARANWRMALEHPEVADRILAFNDDMFVMRPLDKFPVLHRGPIDDVIKLYEHRGISSRYLATMKQTAAWLREYHGIENPLSYELHVPMAVKKQALATVYAVADASGLGDRAHTRTVYGNVLGVGGMLSADVKIYNIHDVPVDDAIFVSTDDRPFKHGAVGQWIRERLPEPCKYERCA